MDNKKRFDVTAVGECLIDFVGLKPDQSGKLLLEGNPGGAPANVLACASRFGLETAFISKLGKDAFGQFLFTELEKAGIDTGAVIISDEPTTIAVVTLDETGNRSFGFYRNQTADVMLASSDIDYSIIDESKILHFGSVSMTAEPSRSATLAAAKYAKEKGLLVSYDPNLRELLWKDKEDAHTVILQGMGFADVVKVSEEELVFLTGENDLCAGMEKLYQTYELKFLAVTLGPKGCICRCKAGSFQSPAFDVKCIDTTGAGDAFWGGALYTIVNRGKDLDDFTPDEIKYLLDFANASGSLTTMRKGAIPALPTLEQIKECIIKIPRCE